MHSWQQKRDCSEVSQGTLCRHFFIMERMVCTSFYGRARKGFEIGNLFRGVRIFFVFPNSNSHLIKIHTTHRSWIKHFHDSLVNFLASLFRRLPLPHIMNFRVAYVVFYVESKQFDTRFTFSPTLDWHSLRHSIDILSDRHETDT